MPTFAAYETYRAAQIAANNSMIALLVSGRLGIQDIKERALPKDMLLSASFDTIKGIERFNLTGTRALAIMEGAENHLVYMAIPYVIAIHEAFIRDVVRLLKSKNHPAVADISKDAISDLKPVELDAIIAKAYHPNVETEYVTLFNIARQMRNRIIHGAGDAGSHIASEYRNLNARPKALWKKLAGRALTDAIVNKRFLFTEGELFAVLAISLRLADAVKEAVLSQSTL